MDLKQIQFESIHKLSEGKQQDYLKDFLNDFCFHQFSILLGVNFTIILQAAFSHESVLCNFSVLAVYVCNFLAKGNLQKKLLVKCW